MTDSPSSPNQNADPDSAAIESKLKKVTQILLLERKVREKKASKNEIGFHITNDTFRLVPYRQCYLWSLNLDKVKMTHASGVSRVDTDSVFIQWFSGLIKRTVRSVDFQKNSDETWATVHDVSKSDCNPDDREQWDKWCQAHAVIVLFWSPDERCFGGIWFDRETPFQDSEKMLLSQVSDAYAHAIYTQQKLEKRTWYENIRALFWGTNLRRVLVVVLILIAIFPIRQSATAPTEVIPQNPYMISAPVDAVVEDIRVEPNQLVKEGDVLVTFDDTELRSQIEVAEKEVQILSTELAQASRQAFSEDRSKGQLALLKSQIETKRTEIDYLEQRLNLMSLEAPHAGQVVFSDPFELRGQLKRTGQRLMLLAKPEDSELLVRIPVDNMVQLNPDVPVRAFLNIAPLKEYSAEIHYVSYQASADSDGLMTYKAKARFVNTDDRPVIGLQGTAKVYGDYTVFAYHVLRRPLAWLRKKLGL